MSLPRLLSKKKAKKTTSREVDGTHKLVLLSIIGVRLQDEVSGASRSTSLASTANVHSPRPRFQTVPAFRVHLKSCIKNIRMAHHRSLKTTSCYFPTTMRHSDVVKNTHRNYKRPQITVRKFTLLYVTCFRANKSMRQCGKTTVTPLWNSQRESNPHHSAWKAEIIAIIR